MPVRRTIIAPVLLAIATIGSLVVGPTIAALSTVGPAASTVAVGTISPDAMGYHS
jgi:hypothetical protein